MRYLPDNALYFVHIPKNGGQSVRNAMARSGSLSFKPLAQDLGVSEDEAEQACEKGVDHSSLSMVHPAHIPLWALSEHFPASWGRFKQSRSFALVRSPRDRFISALLQRLKEFRGATDVTTAEELVVEEAKSVCAWLDARTRFVDLEYTHFIKQVEFTDLEGVRLVTRVFPMDKVAAAADWIAATGGPSIEIGHDHSRRQPKPWARQFHRVARGVGKTVLPGQIRKTLRPLWMNSGVFSSAAASYASVEFSPDVETFIAEYYAGDIKLFVEANDALAPVATA